MIICIDIGNTTTDIALYEKDRLVEYRKIDGKKDDFYKVFLSLAKGRNIEGASLCSVVPETFKKLEEAFVETINCPLFILAPETRGDFVLDVDCPDEVGGDIIADAIASKNHYPYPSLIVDLGTATKLIYVDEKGAFSGLSIAPGLMMGIKSLFEKTAALPEIKLDKANKAIGKNTDECILSGTLLGHIEMINGLAARFEKESGHKLFKILTGGNASYVKDYLEGYEYDPLLCLKGLKGIYERGHGDE